VPNLRLLDPNSTAAVILGAHEWTGAGLGRSPSFLRSAKGILGYLLDSAGLGLDPSMVLDLFDDTASAGEQLARIRDTLDSSFRDRRSEGSPITDLIVYYVGHGQTDDEGRLTLLVRRSLLGMEVETGIKAADLARVLRISAPQQRRIIILDCCFSEAAAKAFIGMSSSLGQAVAATAARDLEDDQARRGTLLLCSSPVGQVSMAPPNAAHTLFSGAVLHVLRNGMESRPAELSIADLRDGAFTRMVEDFGANAPRPVLHQVNASHGDLTRAHAFPNIARRRIIEAEARLEAELTATAYYAIQEAQQQASTEQNRVKTERRAARDNAALDARRRAAEEMARPKVEQLESQQRATQEAELRATKATARLEAEKQAAKDRITLEKEQQVKIKVKLDVEQEAVEGREKSRIRKPIARQRIAELINMPDHAPVKKPKISFYRYILPIALLGLICAFIFLNSA
jgi:hypothetical protein